MSSDNNKYPKLDSDAKDKRNSSSEFYCKPPKLVSATFGGQDILPRMEVIYGPACNWNCQFWKASDIQGSFDGKKELEIHWKHDDSDRPCWMKGELANDDTVNNLLFVPFGTNWLTESGI